MSGRKNLRLLAAYDGQGASSRIDEMLDVVELRDRAGDRVGGYSHGMRQRLGIAASLLRNPRLLLLDEPTTGLDPAGMRDMRALVRRLAGEGITVLLSSHLLGEVEDLCNRVAIIRTGTIVYEGTLHDLLATAQTEYRLRATEPERALMICSAQRGVEKIRVEGPELRFQADEQAAAAISIALGQARIGITALVPETASLEELFLGLTGGESGDKSAAAGGGRMTAVYRWELAKLLAQKRTYLGLGAAMLVPLIFVVVLQFQSGGPNDVPLGRYIRDTGLAVPFVALFFMSFWAFPLITSLVAGDVVASESQNGTLKTILTRSRERGQVFAGQGARDAHLHRGCRRRDGDDRADRGRARLGLQPTDVAVRERRCRRATASPCSRRASRSTSCRWPGSRRSRSCSRRSRGTVRRRSWVR